MLKLLERSMRDFRASYPKLLLFEYLYMLLTSFAVVPVITLISNRVLAVLGSGSLLNGEVFRFGFSFQGAIGMTAIGLVVSLALFIELCVLIILVQQRYFGRDVAMADALLTTLRQTPRLLGFGVVQLLMLLLVLIPFIDSPVSTSFYALFNAPIFWRNQVLHASNLMTLLYVLLLLGAVYTLLRWIFVLHFIVLEGRTIAVAIRSSLTLTRGRRLQIFAVLLLLNAGVFAAGFATLSTLSSLPSWFDLNVLKAISDHYSLTLSTILTYMFTLLLMPVNMIVLTRLFYSFNRSRGLKPQNTLIIRRTALGRLEQRTFAYWRSRPHKRWVYAAFAIAYLGLALFVGIRANDSFVYAKWTVLISAHRGFAVEAPENSLPSIAAAVEAGIESVELDVQLTKDGVAVLHHDYLLRRLTGVRQPVIELTYAELAKLSIGRDGEGGEIRIPTLADALEEAKGRVKLLLDLKPYGPADELAAETVRLVKAAGMEGDVYIQSFDGNALRQIRALAPDIKIGQILYFALGNLSALDVDFYTVEQVMLTSKLVARAHEGGREVWVWTVNNRRNLKEVMKFEIDGIITDDPVLARSLVELNV